MIKGGGIALALPFLNSMGWAKPAKELPKRMLVSYFSYGAYMPNGTVLSNGAYMPNGAYMAIYT